MKFKLLAKTAAFLTSLFAITDLPVEDGKLALSDDQNAQLKEKVGEESANDIMDALNREIAQLAKGDQENEALNAANKQLKDVQAEVQKMLDATNLTPEEKQGIVEGKGEGTPALTAKLQALSNAQKEQDKKIAKLISAPEDDSPLAVIKNDVKNMKHNATHLFATGQVYDAFEKRAWNQRLRDQSIKATDFNTSGTIPLLQDDMEHFVRENPAALESLFNDFAELPAQWSRRTGVLDRVASGAIIPAEIVQGRKKGWSPKNNFKIAAEERRVFRKKIDITFDGYELQQIENTWIKNWNKDGSHPWKMSFIGFLLTELVKQQKLDDRRAQINGIFVESPEGDGNPGRAVNSQDGLRFLWHYNRDIAKKYRPFHLGEPTKANIVDYIKQAIELIPEEDRNQSGMEIQLSSEMLQWYREKAGIVYQMHKTQNEGTMEYGRNHPIDYPNFLFQELKDQTKTKFIGFTKSSNVEILDYNVSEKGKFTVTHDKRDTNIFADYRLGIGFQFVGTELLPGEPAEFERQVIWSNDMPVFDDSVTAPIFDDKTGIVKVHYNNMKVDDAFATDIAAIKNVTPGTVVKITGSTSLAAAKNVKNNASLLLSADFDLSTGGTLTMFVQPDLKLKEISRTIVAPVSADAEAGNFDGDTIDAKTVNEFFYTGAASATLAEILNGVDGKVIKIYGKDDAAVLTLTVQNVAGNIAVTANAVLASKADYIELVRINGVWTETSRVIA